MATAKLLSAGPFIASSISARISSAVHIKIHPRPRNLAESREVLRVLQRYGEVVMFKRLKYEPEAPAHNSALAIYQDLSSAEQLINASPLRFELEVGKPGATTAMRDLSNIVPTSIDAVSEDAEKQEQHKKSAVFGREDRPGRRAPEAIAPQCRDESNSTGNSFSSTEFEGIPSKSRFSPRQQPTQFTPESPPPHTPGIPSEMPVPTSSISQNATSESTAEPEFREFELRISHSQSSHHAYIERQGYYGGFNLDKNSIMAEDLDGRVPLEGMLDCQISKPEVPLWVMSMKKDRLRKKRASLRQMWEAGRKKKGWDMIPKLYSIGSLD